MIEHERSFIFTHEGAGKFIEDHKLAMENISCVIEDSYLNTNLRIRKITSDDGVNYILTRKIGDKAKGYRIETEENIDRNVAILLVEDACLVVKKTRYKLPIINEYVMTMDFIDKPIRLAVLEIESIKETVSPIPADISSKLFNVELRECPLSAYSFFKRKIGICGGPSTGKCLSEDTLIYVSDKNQWIPIKRLFGNENQETKVLSYDITTRTFQQSSASVISCGKKDIYRVTTRSGVSIEVTADHKFMKFDGSYVETKNIMLKDRVAIIRNIVRADRGNKSKYIGKLLGYFLGEGGLTGGDCKFTNSEDCILEDIFQCARNVQDDIEFIHDQGYTYRFSSGKYSGRNQIRTLLKKFDLFGKNSYTKYISDAIYNLTESDIKGLLSAYFICDGFVDKTGFEFYSVSKILLEGIQRLLWFFGIMSSLQLKNGVYKKRRHISYRLTIQDLHSCRLFYDILQSNVSFHRKSQLLIKSGYKNYLGSLPSSCWDVIKSEAWDNNVMLNPRHSRVKGFYNTIIKSKDRSISRTKFEQICNLVNSYKLKRILHDDAYYDEVVSVKKIGRKETYDLNVPEYSNFVANGFVVHNSETAKVLSHTLNTRFQANSFHVVEFATTFIQKYCKNPMFVNQFFVWHGQYERERNARNADIILSDCPTFLSYIYLLHIAKEKFSTDTALMFAKIYKRVLFDIGSYSDIIFMRPVRYVENNIRYQSGQEALEISERIKGFLDDHNILYKSYDYMQVDSILADLFYINE